jgi:hypothetical protein
MPKRNLDGTLQLLKFVCSPDVWFLRSYDMLKMDIFDLIP